MLYYFTTKDRCREKGRRGGKRKGVAREGGRKRNSGRAPKGKKGLANTKIIFKNISGAAAAPAKNRLERAKSLDDSTADRRSRESRGVREEERTAMWEGYKIITFRKHNQLPH